MADRLNTSSEADEVLNTLHSETRLEKAALARIAFSLSLAKDGAQVASSPNFGGSEIKRPTFVGEDEIFLRSLISFTYKKADIGEEEFFSNHSILKNHIDGGASHLNQLYQECGRDADSLLKRLLGGFYDLHADLLGNYR